MGEWFLNPVHSYTTVTVIGASLLFLLFYFGRETRRLSPFRHWTLFGLRLAVFLSLIAIMLRPTLVISDTKQQSSTIAVMIDHTRSMTVPDGSNGLSRWYELATDLRAAESLFDELGKNYDLEFIMFDQESQSLGSKFNALPLGKEPTGKQTAIGGALEDMLRRLGNKRLSAVILLSDGAQQAYPPRDQAPQISARRLAAAGTALYAITYGKETAPNQARDLSIVDMVLNPTVYVKNVLTVTGTVRVAGFKGQSIKVQLTAEDGSGKEVVVATAPIIADVPDQLIPIELPYIPETSGEHKLTLRAVTPEGLSESNTENNQKSDFVTVIPGGINVLYLEGERRPDSVYLKRAIQNSPDVNLVYHLYDQNNPDKRKNTIDFNDPKLKGNFNCYIIGDLDSMAFRSEDLEAIARNVEKGAGLILLGGYHSYWAGGYQNTPLARVMPLAVNDLDARTSRQSFGEPLRQDLHIRGPLTIVPDPLIGRTVSFLKLAPWDQNARFWAKLPPLKGANRWRTLKPMAKVLARSQNNDPLICALEAQQGRVLAFAGDSTWQWAMQGYGAAHKTFWRQALLWTLKIDETQQGSAWVKLEQRRIVPGRRVDFTAGVNGVDPETLKSVRYSAQVFLPNGQTRTTIVAGVEDLATQVGSFGDTQEPGEYRIEVTATNGDKQIGVAKARFLVLQQDLEMDNSVARPSLMANLAQTTAAAGGEALGRGQLNSLLEKLIKKPRKEEVLSQIKKTPWDSPWAFLFFVTLLTTEWFLRKKWGWV